MAMQCMQYKIIFHKQQTFGLNSGENSRVAWRLLALAMWTMWMCLRKCLSKLGFQKKTPVVNDINNYHGYIIMVHCYYISWLLSWFMVIIMVIITVKSVKIFGPWAPWHPLMTSPYDMHSAASARETRNLRHHGFQVWRGQSRCIHSDPARHWEEWQRP